MSKYNNVNPGQYKVAGRERQGEDIVAERNKQELAKSRQTVREAIRATKRRSRSSGGAGKAPGPSG
jgi:hypothetical protein